MQKLFWALMISLSITILPHGAMGKSDKPSGKQTGPTTFGVSPPTFDLEGVPGETVSGTIKVENPLGMQSRYQLAPVGIVVSGSSFGTKPLSSLPADHLSRNLTVDSPTISVPPRSFKTVSFTIKIPPNATGTQYAGIVVSRMPGATDESAKTDRSSEYERHMGLGMEPAIGITIKIAMKGGISYSYKLDAIRVTPGTGSRPPMAIATIRNTGNGELRINPILMLVDNSGKVSIRLKSESSINLLPGAKQDVTFESQGRDIPGGGYKAILSVPDAKYQLAPAELAVSVK